MDTLSGKMKRCIATILLGLLLVTIPSSILATEYLQPGENGTIYAHVLYVNGTPANSATINLTLWNSSGGRVIDDVNMGYIAGSNGMYHYNFTAPSVVGVYVVDVNSTNPTGYGTDEVHVSNITEAGINITCNLTCNLTAAAIWNETATGYTNTSTFGGIINDALGGDMSDNVLLIGIFGVCIALLVVAYWRKSQMIMWVAALAWVGFTFWQRSITPGWGTWDIHEILFYVGFLMTIICILEAVMMYRGTQPELGKRVAEETMDSAELHKERMAKVRALTERHGKLKRRGP